MYRVQPYEVHRAVDKVPVVVKPNYDKVNRPKNQNGRRGLELAFAQEPEEKLIIKLRMNGWWRSCVNNCWCNLDTAGNRKYAQRMISMADVRFATVSA
jgi:hypothetical protein